MSERSSSQRPADGATSRPDGPLSSASERGGILSRIGARRATVALLAIAFAGSFAFAPVRGLASEMLRVFRVQKVETIAIDPGDIERIGNALSNGEAHVDLEDMGEAWVEGSPEPREVTLEEAQAALDFEIALPDGMSGKRHLVLTPKTAYRFKLNVDAVNESLTALGATRLLPKSVDGKVFSVEMSPMLMAEYEGANDRHPGWAVVGQGRSPRLVMPEGVDPRELRDVLVNLPILPEDVRERLAGISDWQNTLLIPNVGGSAREVTIGGQEGVVMSEPGADTADSGPVAVVWQRDGVVYGVSGDLDETAALRIAESVAAK